MMLNGRLHRKPCMTQSDNLFFRLRSYIFTNKLTRQRKEYIHLPPCRVRVLEPAFDGSPPLAMRPEIHGNRKPRAARGERVGADGSPVILNRGGRPQNAAASEISRS